MKEFVINNEKLMREWNWEKNNALGFYPDKLKRGSNKRVWWKCKNCGYEWITKIAHRTYDDTNCIKCRNLKLATADKSKSLALLFPKIAKEWNYNRNKTTPDCVYPQSNKQYWWICDKGHEWQDAPSHRIKRDNNCPFCSNRKVLQGYNDIYTTHPHLLSEWDYEINNKLGILPTQLSYGSKVKVHWKCKKRHKWIAPLYARTGNKENCPYCNKELRTSFPEKAIAYYIKKIFNDALENYRDGFLGRAELDIFIPSQRIAIEYDGARWHKNIANDILKDKICLENNIYLYRIRENGCPVYDSSSEVINVIPKNDLALENAIKTLFDKISNRYNLNINVKIDIQNDTNLIIQNVKTKEKENSIANSSLISEWNWNKNEGIDPAVIPAFSNKKFWWVCKQGHEWLASAGHRSGGRNCPYCFGNKLLKGFNDLESQYPQLIKEWDFSKNDILPSDITARNGKKVWWICSKCGHSWQTSINVRTSMNCGCPECKKLSISNASSKKVLNIDTGKIYKNSQEIFKELNILPSSISNCCRGVSNTAGGYHWKYVDCENN